MDGFQVVSSPIQPHLTNFIRDCHSTLMIASPYIKKSAVEWLVEIKPPSLKNFSVLTNLSLANILSKSLEISALQLLFATFPNISIISLPHLHAKVFIADGETALVTSANLTNGGLWTNYEYGIIVKHRQVVEDISKDMISYMALGSIVTTNLLQVVDQRIAELTAIQKQAESSSATKILRSKLHASQISLQNTLLSSRLNKGQTINSLFSETIIWIMRRYPNGITTRDLHREVQNIHPDICDDSIDRVINGQHFGKRWKHYVRRAQEHLKDKNIVMNQSGVWRLKEYASPIIPSYN